MISRLFPIAVGKDFFYLQRFLHTSFAFFFSLYMIFGFRYHNVIREEHDGLAASALRRAIAEVMQRWSVMGDQKCFTLAPPWFGSHVKPLVPAAFAVVSTHQPALDSRGVLWHVLLMCNYS
jgi:hypothetical protein